MARPALSAARGIDIIEFLAAFPDSSFTMSQIAAAIGVNAASCHAILTELTERGYLSRNLTLKTYVLGPSLVAMGNAAIRNQGVIARAQLAADLLSREHDVPVSLTRAVGDEVIGIYAVPASHGLGNSARPGHRLPLVPPVGAPFLAWASEAAIAEWIARRGDGVDEAVVATWRDNLALVRKRGYQLLLRSPDEGYFPKMISELASGRQVANYKDRVIEYLASAGQTHRTVQAIEAQELYEVTLIAAPIFDHAAGAVYNLCIGDLPSRITGETIARYADSLLRSCVQIMREDS